MKEKQKHSQVAIMAAAVLAVGIGTLFGGIVFAIVNEFSDTVRLLDDVQLGLGDSDDYGLKYDSGGDTMDFLDGVAGVRGDVDNTGILGWGGGYGATGMDLEQDGDLKMNGDLTVDGSISGTITGANDLLGVANRTTITNGTNAMVTGSDVTVDLPQDIAAASDVQFGSVRAPGQYQTTGPLDAAIVPTDTTPICAYLWDAGVFTSGSPGGLIVAANFNAGPALNGWEDMYILADDLNLSAASNHNILGTLHLALSHQYFDSNNRYIYFANGGNVSCEEGYDIYYDTDGDADEFFRVIENATPVLTLDDAALLLPQTQDIGSVGTPIGDVHAAALAGTTLALTGAVTGPTTGTFSSTLQGAGVTTTTNFDMPNSVQFDEHDTGELTIDVPAGKTVEIDVNSSNVVLVTGAGQWVTGSLEYTTAFAGTTSVTITADDTTPTVLGANHFRIPGTWTASNDITTFDDGTANQWLLIQGGDADCNIVDGANMDLVNDITWNGATGGSIVLYLDGVTWKEIVRRGDVHYVDHSMQFSGKLEMENDPVDGCLYGCEDAAEYSETTVANTYAQAYDDGTTTYTQLDSTSGSGQYTADFQCWPDAEAVNDAVYFGHSVAVAQWSIDVDTAAQYAGDSVLWEYWDGDSWEAITIVNFFTDSTDSSTALQPLQRDGGDVVYPADDWAANTVNSQLAYWLRGRVTAADITTIPILVDEPAYSWITYGPRTHGTRSISGVRMVNLEKNAHTGANIKLFIMNIDSGTHSDIIEWPSGTRYFYDDDFSFTAAHEDKLVIFCTQDAGDKEPEEVVFELYGAQL
ncbi:MAG: hypothetical protein GY832_22045 [Chloroflexi bacterium]|nr:hypothetical protein [Chloroflexota bacterium]